MSYDIELKDPVMGETINFDNPHQMRGGTYQVGGSTEAWINITYNYSGYYYDATENDPRFFGKTKNDYPEEEPRNLGIRGIYGKTGAESIPMLRDMIRRITEKYSKDGEWITTDRDEHGCIEKVFEGVSTNYWKATEGHGRKAGLGGSVRRYRRPL